MAGNAPPGDFAYFETRLRTVIALAVGIATFFALRFVTGTSECVIGAWDGFAFTMLAIIWTSIFVLGVDHIRYRARSEDPSRVFVFIFTIAGACLSVFAVVALLSAAKQTAHLGLHVTLSAVAVLASWTLVHTMFALRYAHFYYDEGTSPEKPAGGLEFPGDTEPNYLDFAYFSFVVGMTCQVSDVQICSKRLRALALVHGILSFCFNTVILALTINCVSGLL